MKKILSILFVGLLLVPTLAFAETKYETKNLSEVIAEENEYEKEVAKMQETETGKKVEPELIESKLGNYKESDKKVNVYLFRGLGCGFCRGFIEYLNNNIDELGEYFNLVSYEVWNDNTNSKLLTEVGNFTGVPARGVPYIVVGDKVFDGFTEAVYGEDFKAKLIEEYNNKNRYDVFTEMEKAKNSNGSTNNTNVIVWNAVFSAITIGAVYLMYNKTNKKLDVILETNKKTKKK